TAGADPFPKPMRGTDQGDVGGCCRGGGADRISSLSDDLLHIILLHLTNAAEAARTSILCRRWRRVWAYLPELSFCYQNEPRTFASTPPWPRAHSAATVTRLEITIPDGSPGIPTDSVSPWLRFASERLTGELSLSLPYNSAEQEEEELLLPPCERLTAIRFDLNRTLRFQLPPTGGAFPALATHKITNARVDGRELERFLSTRCPRLEELVLEWITLRDGAPVLSIRSDSLRRLETSGMGFEGQLQVAAPQLRWLCPESLCGLHVAAPNLSELLWESPNYDPTRHRFAEAGRHLLRL
uniref:F-box domain-containing protein n=1 Tax=Setaria italica TaxID=4555 RepID=K4A3B5_SETIT